MTSSFLSTETAMVQIPKVIAMNAMDEPVCSLSVANCLEVFVTIGAGETAIVPRTLNGDCRNYWIATFGWSGLLGIPLTLPDGRRLHLDGHDIGLLTAALRGTAYISGMKVDTSTYAEAASAHLRSELSNALHSTVGSATRYGRIHLAAPAWLKQSLRPSLDLLHNINPTVMET